MPVVQVWPCPGKSIEQLQFVNASGPLGCTSAGISCITFLTFSSEFGSDFGAGNKKSHYHKGAYNIYWNSNFFSLSKLFFKFCKPHRINVKHKLISLISGTIIWAQERMAVLSLLAYCKFFNISVHVSAKSISYSPKQQREFHSFHKISKTENVKPAKETLPPTSANDVCKYRLIQPPQTFLSFSF